MRLVVVGRQRRRPAVEPPTRRSGIDLRRFDPYSAESAREATRQALGLADDDVLFLSAGRLIVSKGFVELFEAAALAREADP